MLDYAPCVTAAVPAAQLGACWLQQWYKDMGCLPCALLLHNWAGASLYMIFLTGAWYMLPCVVACWDKHVLLLHRESCSNCQGSNWWSRADCRAEAGGSSSFDTAGQVQCNPPCLVSWLTILLAQLDLLLLLLLLLLRLHVSCACLPRAVQNIIT